MCNNATAKTHTGVKGVKNYGGQSKFLSDLLAWGLFAWGGKNWRISLVHMVACFSWAVLWSCICLWLFSTHCLMYWVGCCIISLTVEWVISMCKSGSWVASWNICLTEVFNWEWSVFVIIDGCRWLLWVVQDLRMVCQLSCMIFTKNW